MVTYDVCPNLSFLNINMIYRQKILMTTERTHYTINCTMFKGAVNMPSVNYSNARQNFKELITKVNEDSVAYTITTKENENAVILAEKDYNAMLETMYLQSNLANVSHLNQSIMELNHNQTITIEIDDNE